MGDQTYRLVFDGQLEPGRDPEEVKRRLADGLRVDGEKLRRLFSGQRLTRHHLSAEQARRFEFVFRNAGAVCKILPEDTPPDRRDPPLPPPRPRSRQSPTKRQRFPPRRK